MLMKLITVFSIGIFLFPGIPVQQENETRPKISVTEKSIVKNIGQSKYKITFWCAGSKSLKFDNFDAKADVKTIAPSFHLRITNSGKTGVFHRGTGVGKPILNWRKSNGKNWTSCNVLLCGHDISVHEIPAGKSVVFRGALRAPSEYWTKRCKVSFYVEGAMIRIISERLDE